ncbi:MAG: hypothetical protein GEV13_21005 [Rhodospirillales bacterium]|nr:hypothetical protein [Rhodospirillales bacterium]
MKQSGRRWMRAAVLAGTAVFAIASSGNAQTVTLGPEGVTQSEGLGRAFQTFSILGGTPGIAAARYYSNFDLNSFQLPIGHSFDPIEGGFLSGVAPYAEITLGYLTGSQTFPLTSDGNSPNSVKLTFNAWSALAGGGIDVPLGNGFKVRPIVLAGYSYVGGDAHFFGPNSVLARSQVSGILSDASLSSVLLGGALELIYETPLRGDTNLRAQARYNELVALVTGASSSALQGNDSFGVANGSVTLTGPTGWHIAANAVRWLGYAKGTWLPDTNPSVLGFNAFAEVGGGLQIIAPGVIRGVQGATVRASAIAGPGVTAWLVSAALNF